MYDGMILSESDTIVKVLTMVESNYWLLLMFRIKKVNS